MTVLFRGARRFLASTAIALLTAPASAALVTFTGEDVVATTTAPRPNATAAATAFDAAAALLGTVGRIDFESAAIGSFHNLAIAPGVSVNGVDYDGLDQTIRNTSNSPSIPTLDGYNTTASGARFVEMAGNTLTFTFAQGTQFFGVFLTGIQTVFFADTITFNDGTSQTILVPGAGTSNSAGAVDFVGFTDANRFITSVTINAGVRSTGVDFIGADDVRYQVVPAVVPEPESAALLALGVAGLAIARRRRARV